MSLKLHQPTLRVVKILRQLRLCEQGLSNAELSRMCDIMPGTLHPILKTLCASGVCEYKNKKYLLASDDLIYERRLELISAYAKELACELKLSAQIGVLQGSNVLYERKLDGGAKVVLRTKVGDLAPVHATALGKALLSEFLNDYELFKKHLKITNGKLQALTDSTITDIASLYENVKMFERLGYFSERGEYDEDFICFAVPLKVKDSIVAALSITLLKFHLSDELKAKVIDRLRFYAHLINSNLS